MINFVSPSNHAILFLLYKIFTSNNIWWFSEDFRPLSKDFRKFPKFVWGPDKCFWTFSEDFQTFSKDCQRLPLKIQRCFNHRKQIQVYLRDKKMLQKRYLHTWGSSSWTSGFCLSLAQWAFDFYWEHFTRNSNNRLKY